LPDETPDDTESTAMPDQRLSVVIPTYNRRARLERVLAALEKQTGVSGDFEVVVVDDGSSDGSSEWLATRRASYALRSLKLPNGGPARARNAGIDAAAGEIVLFIDDDVEPTPSLVAEHLRSHDAERDVVVIGPLASLPRYEQPWVAWEQAKVEAQYDAMSRGRFEPTFRQFWTGNASVERRHLLAAGKFDPAFLRAEDVELGLRLTNLGLKFRFNANARGLHHAERSLASWEGVQSSYGRLEVEIFGKLGEAELLDILADNWSRVHPSIRTIVVGCIGNPALHSALKKLLHGHLELARRVPVPLMADKACSLLANLMYWQASTAALGPQRTSLVFETGAAR
jgi:glycosyltransferase involved in cell wall biosynthesis